MTLICAWLLALAPAAAGAQTVTGTIQGTVADTSGGVLPGTTVAITQAETGSSRTVVTTESGFFTAPYVPIGTYRIVATLSGCTRNVDLALSKVFRLPRRGQTLAARIEAFNAFNLVQFGFPNTDFTTASFGALNSLATSYSPRTLQLVLRYRY